MAAYYDIQPYGATYLPRYHRDEIEYPGYDNNWVLGREREGYYHDDYRRFPSLNYSSYQYHPSTRSEYYYPHSRHHHNGNAHLAWATEIPVRLRVTICCEGCKMKLDRALRNMHGVHDVGISGWTNAVVTVTGTASARKLLKKARKVSKSAEFWIDSTYPHDHGSYSYSRHH